MPSGCPVRLLGHREFLPYWSLVDPAPPRKIPGGQTGIWQASCFHFGILGGHIGTLGEPWEAIGAADRILIDFGWIWGLHVFRFSDTLESHWFFSHSYCQVLLRRIIHAELEKPSVCISLFSPPVGFFPTRATLRFEIKPNQKKRQIMKTKKTCAAKW